jgi:type VI protein secretion system component VasF
MRTITNKAQFDGLTTDQILDKMIRSSDKAPKNLSRYRGVTKGEVKQKMKLPWTLIIIVGAIIIIVALYILWRTKTRERAGGNGMVPGDRLDEPRDIEGLLDDIGYIS